ncbi:fungal-specific transcription factor domain-containing protein [Corynascus novoguineensis]|uniref:Fungal-specific transcription factor domain-containing protein n=1 Tax=Corynascus novoguineensis TaxID=1126955 RepID=A0AAN7HBJ5_9PEZI|nr:fungal-specific transcription factor domain-containing protein [Corynascus novoguineensis]
MTRPKVPDDKRQRTAQACDSCKRRKQKCNGSKPCQTCLRRKLTCCYTPNNASDHVADSAASPTKRRHLGTSPPSISSVLEASGETSPRSGDAMQPWNQTQKNEHQPGSSSISGMTSQTPLSMPAPVHVRQGSIHDFKRLPSRNNVKGLSEETNIYTETRMLQDQTGRLLYIGDASTLSILQLIRIVVENTAGSDVGSPFIDDPKRHRILESIIDFPDNVPVPCPLPDKETADVLITSYFTNTCGLVEILDKASFLRSVEECYRDPPSSRNDFLCNLYLVLALGLLLAAPAPGSRDEAAVQRQLAAQPNRAELFFRSARSMCDPASGFEDADFWSIQSLALMTIYMLIHSKRNRAYAYLGMAVRSAFALGLHREETMRDVIFTPAEMRVRRNLWKTLFILDRFLAATLGRPTAISEDDCSCKILPDGDVAEMPTLIEPGFDHIHARSLDACVETAHVIGVTLKVFSRRKISTAKVQEIVDMSRNWDQASRAQSYRRHSGGGPVNPAHGVASLHVSLFSLHSLILLTRQLFVMHNWMLVEERSGIKNSAHIRDSSTARFSEACVVASYRTIELARSAWEDGYLPRRNPFVIYFIFAASLVILMNQFSSLYYTSDYDQTMRDALDIMTYCAEIDPQAQRVLDIITRFSEVVTKWTKDHTFNAPRLSDDFSCLYNQAPPSGTGSEHMVSGSALDTGIQGQASPQAVKSDPGLLTPPSMAKVPTLDVQSTQAPGALLEATRVNGMSSPHVQIPPVTLVGGRPSTASHSSLASTEPHSGNIEFEFDGLWNSFINHLPPVSSVAPGINSLALQFPPPVIGAPTEPYDKPGF